MNTNGSGLVYATYLGGDSWDGIAGIAVDKTGHAYVTGDTQSTNFPTTPGAWDQTCSNCGVDGFVARLNPDGDALAYSTFVGGDMPASEGFSAIAVDAAGQAYVVGITTAADFPTANPLQPTNHGGKEAFVAKLKANGSGLLYSAYLGGSGDENFDGNNGPNSLLGGITVNKAGVVYVTGTTGSPDFPLANPLQTAFGGLYDAFVLKLRDKGN